MKLEDVDLNCLLLFLNSIKLTGDMSFASRVTLIKIDLGSVKINIPNEYIFSSILVLFLQVLGPFE